MSSPSILVWYQYVASTRTHARELPFALCCFLSLSFLSKHQLILKAFLFRPPLWAALPFGFLLQHLIVSRFRRQTDFSYSAKIPQPSVIWFGSGKTRKSAAACVSCLMVAGVWPQSASWLTIIIRRNNPASLCIPHWSDFLSFSLITALLLVKRRLWLTAARVRSVGLNEQRLLNTDTHVGKMLHTHT